MPSHELAHRCAAGHEPVEWWGGPACWFCGSSDAAPIPDDEELDE